MGRGTYRIGPGFGLPALLVVLLPWALLGGGAGCISKPPPPPTELCPSTGIGVTPASPSVRRYVYDTLGKIVDARGVDWSGQQRHGVELDGSKSGCFQGGGITAGAAAFGSARDAATLDILAKASINAHLLIIVSALVGTGLSLILPSTPGGRGIPPSVTS